MAPYCAVPVHAPLEDSKVKPVISYLTIDSWSASPEDTTEARSGAELLPACANPPAEIATISATSLAELVVVSVVDEQPKPSGNSKTRMAMRGPDFWNALITPI